jgi:UMF1 family MFS transporter
MMLYFQSDHYIDFGNLKNPALISFGDGFASYCVFSLSPLYLELQIMLETVPSVVLGALSCMGLYWFNLENIYIGLTFYSFF